MGETKQVILPITGMTCANCVATIERNLRKMEGVQSAIVNLSSERATVEYNPDQLTMEAIVGRIQKAGYDVAEGEADLAIHHMSDDNDARRLERVLRKIDGIREVQVNITTERARVVFVPTLVSQSDIRQAISNAGFEAVDLGDQAEDAEAVGDLGK